MPLGYVLGVVVLALAQATPTSLAVGALLGLAGEAVRLWASGHIEKTRTLATGGPYAHTRNPLYVGSVLMALGVAAGSASLWVVLAAFVYFAAFYPSVIREEAGFLAAKFPEYADWAKEVPVFLPRFTPGGPRGSRFRWERVRGNREWRTALALPAAMLLLWARSFL